jgi:hypothetical protein
MIEKGDIQQNFKFKKIFWELMGINVVSQKKKSKKIVRSIG